MYAWKRRRASLMPAVALATLSAMIAIPALSQARLFAAGPQHRVGVTVHLGDSLWSIADRYTPSGENVQDTVDRIMAANALKTAAVVPGEKLEIPR